MSSSYVRNNLKDVASSITIDQIKFTYQSKFYDTVNKVVKPVEDFWFTARFNLEDTLKDTFDDQYIETGLIDLIFSCPGGAGDNIIEACEEISRKIYKIINANDDSFTITKVMAPEELEVKASLGFEIAVGLEYSYIYNIS